MTITPATASADDDSDDSTVSTDDEEFSEFITSQWKESVEVGLVIRYPLLFTNYLAAAGPSDEKAKKEESPVETKSVVGSSIVIECTDGDADKPPLEDLPPPNTLPTLTLSTVLEEKSIAPLFDGTQWAGTRVWKAAVLGLEYLLRERQRQPIGEGSRLGSLLELGCGLGVPGMIWKQILSTELQEQQQLPPPRVVLTDRDSLVSQLRANVEANFPDDPSIVAMALDWSREGITSLLRDELAKRGPAAPSEGTPIFDVCLNCDCVYEPLYGREAWESLADVLSEVASASPATLLVTALERRNGDNVEGFLERLEVSGKVETPIERAIRHDQDPHHVIEIYVTRGKAAAASL
jgi:hypothetical protein